MRITRTTLHHEAARSESIIVVEVIPKPVLAPIASHLAEWETPHVEIAIHGTGDAQRVAAAIGEFCQRALGTAPARTLFYGSSVAAVAGLELLDGRRVVVKAHQPDWDHRRLEEIVRLQSVVAAKSGLAPRVLLGPTPLGNGLATVEELVDRGATPDGHDPAVRRAMARALHAIVEILVRFASATQLPASLLTSSERKTLWPRPHSRLFDFETTQDGAGYIDDVARDARARMAGAGRSVIGHGDWRAEHVRFIDDALVMAFDWDSLSAEREPALLGTTVHMFCANWSRDDVVQAPTLEEARAFVAEYEEAAGRKFTRPERTLCGAAFAYAVAYTSRCGHSAGVDTRDQEGTFQHLIARHGKRLLEL